MDSRARIGVFASWLLVLGSSLVFGQGAGIPSSQHASADSDRDQPARREQWFMHGRVVPGQSAAALRYRAHQQKMQLRAARAWEAKTTAVTTPSSPTNIWTPLGPAPLASDATGFGGQDYGWVSGRATAVAIDPADTTGNTVYIGGAYGGVWKSVNAGPLSANPANVIWAPLMDNQATLAVGSIAIQPGNSDPTKSVVLIGTGETNSSLDSYYELGILRSLDAGNTWALVTQDKTNSHSFAGLGFSKIAFSAANPSLAVAAASGATQGVIEALEVPVNTNRGLYYSTDGGQSWSYASVQDAGTTIDASSVTSVVYNAAAGEFFAAVRWHGIYSSSDGINWSRLTNQPGGLSSFLCPTNPASQSCPIYRGEFAVVPGRNEMYVWYVDSNENDQGIWKTTDGGNTWTQINDTGIANCGDVLGGCGTSQGVYNLELAAVPNGSATDLYAGAINLYKCTITASSPACSGSGSHTFLNLTHVYGCAPDFGSIAHVHPDQHALDFMLVNSNTQDVMYFANDGGIYRTLDGYAGLTSGTCGATNQFDSLNQTLGSMTQFVSFSQHPNDPNTLLGGTQDNGSPATSSSQSSSSWLNVNSGDGGYNAINPDNPTEWFTANTDVSIQRCELGVNCHAGDFSNGLVVSNATVGGDAGPFYTPYILDPQNSGELLVGTCRVWRGGTSGAGFNVLTNSFETGGSDSCTGSEVNMVRSLAAGGLKDTSGFSNVIYAGTDGFGPVAPSGGHIWVTPNAGSGAGGWFDRTGQVNPGSFPVSGVALDTSDATGGTAYITIMGFHVSHIWKTTSAGVSWTDFTANLPDAPANAILVDAAGGAVYVGTDVGVFSSGTTSANWTEVGPAPGSSQAGFLPNVSVTALRMFNSDGTKKLRASTYGRGVWEFTLVAGPDFQFAVSNNPLTVFAGQTASFTGSLQALNGYGSTVNLSCVKGATVPPPTCELVPVRATPTSTGVAFTVNASGPAGDYLFDAQGAGTDANSITRDFSLTLHVVDFNLTGLAPPSVAVAKGATSGPVSFQVTAAGTFSGPVALSCSGLPAGATCNFQPSSSVSPVAGAPASVTLMVNTSASTPVGTSTITIAANTAGAPSAKTQTLGLTVNGATSSNYTLAISDPSLTVGVTGQATFNGTLTSSGGYNNAVILSCGGAGPPTCIPSANSITPSAAGTAFTIVAGSNAVQNYSFNIVATGTDAAHITDSMAVALQVSFDFVLNNNSGPQTTPVGQPVSYQLDARPLGSGNTFPASVTFACSNLPPLTTCSFTPPGVSSGSGDSNVLVTVQTTAPVQARARNGHRDSSRRMALWLTIPGLALAGFGWREKHAGRSTRSTRCVLLMTLVCLGGLQISCGGGGLTGEGGGGGSANPGTPPNSYMITVDATMSGASGTQVRTASLALTVQ